MIKEEEEKERIETNFLCHITKMKNLIYRYKMQPK